MTAAPLRIAYVVRAFPCRSEGFILREMAALVDRGVDLRIFALHAEADAPLSPQAQELLPRVIYSDKVQPLAAFNALVCRPKHTITALHRSRLGIARAFRRLSAASYFAAAARAADVRHIHAHFAGVPAETALVMANLLRLPYSVSVHAWDIYAQSPQRVMQSLNRAAFVVCCTRAAREHLVSTCPALDPDRLHALHHGVIPLERPAPAPERANMILAVGRFVEKKGFNVLVEACGQLVESCPRLECVIAGDGPGRDALQERIQRLGLGSRVRLPGWLPPHGLASLYARAALLAVPSVVADDGDRDGLPNVILEAMAAGLPVVASDLSGIAEAVADGENGLLVPPGDAGALANRLGSLLTDPDRRRVMGDAGRARLQRDFDPRKNVMPLVALFARAAGQ